VVQVPKQGRNLHRISAFQVLPVEQVPTIKWNLLHLALNLRRPARDLRRTARNLQLQFH
jgi:hypothetical protein